MSPEKEGSEATEKSGSDSAEKKTEDVSDSALSNAYHKQLESEATEKVAGKEDEGKEGEEDTEQSGEEKESELDEVSKTILETLESEEESKEKSSGGQTPEQKLKELERKNKELYEQLQASKAGKETQPVKQMSQEEFLKKVEEEYGIDRDAFPKTLKLLNDYKADLITPEIESLRAEIANLQLKGQLSDNKLYNKLKSDVNDLINSDPDFKGLPKQLQIKFALLKAKDKKFADIVKTIRKQEAAKAKANKRVIVNDKSSAGSSKTSESTGRKLTDADRILAKRMGLTDKDLKEADKPLNLD